MVRDPVASDRELEILDEWIEKWRKERLRRESLAYRQSLELLRAIRLAPSVGIAESILRRERVPRSAMVQEWLEAYGI